MDLAAVAAVIYHLASATEIRAGVRGDQYLPAGFDSDGFVHCTGEPDTTVSVAADYFADVAEPVMVLEIDPDRLTARCVFEPPAPIPGGGTAHLEQAALFPHVYGAIDLAAITGIAEIGRAGNFRWPSRFGAIGEFLG